MSEKVAVPKISTPAEVVAYKATQLKPVPKDARSAANGDLKHGIVIEPGRSVFELIFDKPIDYIDITLKNDSAKATGKLRGLGLETGNFLSYFPLGNKITYRFYSAINAVGNLLVEFDVPDNQIQFTNLSGFRLVNREDPAKAKHIETKISKQDNPAIILPVAAKVRTKQGETIPCPELMDGNLDDSGFSFTGVNYQFVQVTYGEPVNRVEIMGVNDGRNKPISLSFNGKRLVDDIRKDFGNGILHTAEYKLPGEKGVITINTDFALGTFTFHEINVYKGK